jgi:hypothetical protein
MDELRERLKTHGLEINEEKSRLMRYKRPPLKGKDPEGEAGSFDFSGFTHYRGKSLKGYNIRNLKTAKKKVSRMR